jgi:hypothetical protein
MAMVLEVVSMRHRLVLVATSLSNGGELSLTSVETHADHTLTVWEVEGCVPVPSAVLNANGSEKVGVLRTVHRGAITKKPPLGHR